MRLLSPVSQKQFYLFLIFHHRAKLQYAFLEKRFIWGGTIRFIIQQFQPLIFSSLINIRSVSLSDFKALSPGNKFNFCLSALIFAGMLASIVIFHIIVKIGKARENRYSSLNEGFNQSKNTFAKYWIVWTLEKWTIMCLIMILLSDYPSQQLQILTVLSIFSAILQFIIKPMDSKIENSICLFNELMTIIYLYALICLANAGDDIELREGIGLALITILLFVILANLAKVFVMIGIEIVQKFKGKRCFSILHVIHLRNQVMKFPSSIPNIQILQQENKEEVVKEQKEEIKMNGKEERIYKFEQKAKKNMKTIRRRLVIIQMNDQNEVATPLQSQIQSIRAQEVAIQKFS
ncbi:hypothetical protein FGO68_gene11927 [Halteria grandinella]|uniref:Transmembrane protein n=1 Tax=Halteria grandinella TaxID=5974 RepID=A0A8J8P5Z3_HALGN|nr:hypothetical protein FGO68_gene11927 [Halteria grandinella]